MRRKSGIAAVLAVLLAVAATTSSGPVVAGSPQATAVTVDAAGAARLISQYRASRGLPPVKLSVSLNRIAATHSQRMAAMDRLDHVLPGEGSFEQRIAAGGYAAGTVAENIAAGQDNLAAALAAWKSSPPHNANLLNRNISEIGIALYTTPAGPYHTYWTLVLAQPAEASPSREGPGTPFRGLFGG